MLSSQIFASTSLGEGFGGLAIPSNEATTQSLTHSTDTTSASTSANSNILWGATAAALIGWATATAWEEKKKRKALDRASRDEQEQVKARASRDEEPPMTRQEKELAKQRKELQKLWDGNGAAIYEANREYKTKHGKEMDAAARSKAIKDATMNGVFNAGAYASNLEAEKMRRDAQNERMANKMTRIEKEEEVRWQASQKASEEKQTAEELRTGYAAYYAAMKQGEQEAQTNWWDKAVDFVQKKIVSPLTKIGQVVSNPAQSFANLQSTQGRGKLAMPVPYDDPPNWFEVQLSKIRNHLFSSGNEPPTAFDRIVSTLDNFPVIELNGWSDWSDSRKELLTSISDAQSDNQYHYDDHYLELGAWNSNISVNQLNTLQTYVEDGKVSFEDILANIETLQVYKDYDNAEMVTALREIYYAGALDPFILGAQNYNSSAFNVLGSGNGISEGDAQFALATMMLTTQGEDYAPPIVKIQHPQGYTTDGEFGLDHIIAALAAKFHESTEGYIFSDGVDNEVRPPWFGFIGTNPISGELESVKNRIAKIAFWRLDLDPKTIQSIPAVTWQGDLAGSTAMAYQNRDAEKGYNIEMPLADFESDILGVVLTSNNAINPNGTNLAQELSTALAADSPYVTHKYQRIAKLLNIQYVPQTGEIQPGSAQEFLINNLEMVSDLGTGFYASGNMLSGLNLVFSSKEQSTIHAYAEVQIAHFLQQIQDGIQEEVTR